MGDNALTTQVTLPQTPEGGALRLTVSTVSSIYLIMVSLFFSFLFLNMAAKAREMWGLQGTTVFCYATGESAGRSPFVF